MKNYQQPGNVLTMVAGTGGVASGEFVLENLLFGVAATSADETEEYELALGGVSEFTKNSAEAWAVGEAIYWDATNEFMTTTSSGNTKVGVAAAVAANPSGLGSVRLNNTF